MNIYKFPSKADWDDILKRPSIDSSSLIQSTKAILEDVRAKGDESVKKYSLQFDGISVDEMKVSENEISEAVAHIDTTLKDAIDQAHSNIEKFHLSQVQSTIPVETMPGVKCWRKNVGIEKVGLYIPGGSAPLFSTVLMLAIPANIAGCKEIVLCTPPGKDGKIHPAILYAANKSGVNSIFKIGGVQAIASMTYGTESVPKVHKIFGPGNQYVTCAKMLVQQDGMAIDMPAGPSEVCVLADNSANPSFIAADLLSQAEHGPDSQVVLISDSWTILESVQKEISKQLELLPRKELAVQSLNNSRLVLIENLDRGIELVNAYAPEHLIIACEKDETISEKIINAGSVFLGNYAPESVGDYASGTNHTLPTNGYARAYSGVSIDSFVKKITYQKLSEAGLKTIAPTVVAMAEAEQLHGHANAVLIRFNS
ncbi:MAG: histidinol dehydrogenase [Bacteroidetes bacterium]|nr:MAG: histidinol dehydrogenase [Bacteroidota bacterium]